MAQGVVYSGARMVQRIAKAERWADVDHEGHEEFDDVDDGNFEEETLTSTCSDQFSNQSWDQVVGAEASQGPSGNSVRAASASDRKGDLKKSSKSKTKPTRASRRAATTFETLPGLPPDDPLQAAWLLHWQGLQRQR